MNDTDEQSHRFTRRQLTAYAVIALAVLCLISGFAKAYLHNANMGKTVSSEIEAPSVQLDEIPAYSGMPYVQLNGNSPYFNVDEYKAQSFEAYSYHDAANRCRVAIAMVGTDLMPTEERGSIGDVKPTGWHLVKYDWVDGKYLYNRCHLIGYQLTGENANERNLITGTRYMNVEGMEPFESQVAQYVENTGNHVLYRVTPLFSGNDLLARGVVIEAESVEDDGAGVKFCVFCYNVQPGVTIDYATGDNASDGTMESQVDATSENAQAAESQEGSSSGDEQAAPSGDQAEPTYILNTNSMKFHYPWCSSVDDMSEKNKRLFYGTRDEAVNGGYAPCKRCNP